MLRNNADVRRCSYFELGLPVDQPVTMYSVQGNTFSENFPKTPNIDI